MKTLTRIMLSAMPVLVVLLLPAVVYGESLADKRSDTPVETWGNQEAELERAILTETIDPTAAGNTASGDMGSQQDAIRQHGSNQTHGVKQYPRASDYKRAVFGPN